MIEFELKGKDPSYYDDLRKSVQRIYQHILLVLRILLVHVQHLLTEEASANQNTDLNWSNSI